MSRSLSVKCLLSQQQAVLFPSLTFFVLKCMSVCKTEALHTEDDGSSALLCCTEGPGDTYFAGNEYNGTIRHLVRGKNKQTKQQEKPTPPPPSKGCFFQRSFLSCSFLLWYIWGNRMKDLSGTCREWMTWWWSVKWPLKHWPFILNTLFGVEI